LQKASGFQAMCLNIFLKYDYNFLKKEKVLGKAREGLSEKGYIYKKCWR